MYQLLLILLLCELISCNRDKEAKSLNFSTKSGEVIKIDPSIVSNLSMNDLYSKVELIPLETNSKSIIKEVSKIVYFEKTYFILDEDQNAVLMFDSVGKFLNKIQNTGNGPGEYSLLYDFDINPFTKKLELLNPRGELLTYEKSGTFINSISIPLKAPQRFIILTEDLVLFYSLYDQYKLAFFSKGKDSIIGTRFEFPDIILKTPLISSKSSPFNRYDSTITFFQGFSNEVFNVTSTELALRSKWDFGKNNFMLSELIADQPNNYYAIFLRNSNFVHSFNYYIENGKYIYTRFMYDKIWTTLIFNKTKSEYHIIKKFKEQTVPPAYPVFFDKGILTAIDPLQIQILVKESILDLKNKDIYNSLKLENNPVIIRYYFKEQ